MITAIIDAGQHYCQAVSDLWQWDYGQTLRIQGVKLPAAVEIQFSTTERIGETVTRIGVTQEGVTEVPVPDTLLEGGGTTQDYTIYAFVYIENGDSGKTEYRVSMKVRARPKPEAHATPEEGELFRQAIVAVAESADRAESARKSAEKAADKAESAKNAAESASGSAQASADEAKTSKENAETAVKNAEAFKTETETARSEAVRAATESTDAKDSAEKSRAAAEKAKQDAEAAKAAADADKEAAETARSEAETAKNDAVQAKEAAEKAKIGTAADRETAETASKVAQISATSAEKSAKKAEAAKEEIQESAEQIQKNATEIDSLKENKITKPAEAPTIGKILRVKSVNEDGTFVCEWADSGGSNLDVRINGESIVQNGTAEIPLCTKTKEAGLISIDTYTSNGGLHRANNETGLIRIASATNNQIDERRNQFCPIVPKTIDYAVKAAMCDGKGAAWTSDEQAAARERIGITDFKNVVSATLEEESLINITLDKDGNTFDYDETYIRLIIPKTLENISTSIVVGDFTFYVASITNASWNMNYFDIYAKRINGIGFCEYISHTNAEGNMGYVFRSIPRENIRKFHKFGTYKPFPAGTKIIMYAR